eukprot:2222912-Prymnesium_polylepis.1
MDVQRGELQTSSLEQQEEAVAHVRQVAEMETEHSSFLQNLEQKVEERARQMEDEQDQLLLEARTKYDSQTRQLSMEKNDLQVQQALTRQKIEKYKREKESYEGVKEEMALEANDMEKQARTSLRRRCARWLPRPPAACVRQCSPPLCHTPAAQIREMELTIAKLRREATYRERVLAERDKQFVAMRETNQKGEAARSLLEMRIKELQAEHDPVKGEVIELKAMVSDLESA